MPKIIQKATPVDAGIAEPKSITPIVLQQNTLVKPEQDFDIDGFLTMRQEFITKVNKIMVKGSDYHEIQNKKSLAKGGAEKIASIFGWTAEFTKDTDVTESFGDVKGIIAFVCNLAKGDKIVGQGRGAAILSKNAGDPNKTIKMAQKSAFIDAVLRASGLSDFFTQDLEDMNVNDIGKPQQSNSYPPSEKQIQIIEDTMLKKGVTEEMLISDGFDLKGLTGGREGTASELIQYLFDYKPVQSTFVAEKPNFEPIVDHSQIFIKRLDQCVTVDEFNQIIAEVKFALELKNISVDDNNKIAIVAKKVMVKITNKFETPKY